MKKKNKPVFIPGFRRSVENGPAQQDSKMSNLGMGLIGPMGHIGLMGRKPVMENRPAQRYSGMSILETSPYRPSCPYRPLNFKNQSRSTGLRKLYFGNGTEGSSKILKCGSSKVMKQKRLMGRKHIGKNSPAQRDSENSNLGVMGILGCKTKTSPVQWDSGIYKLWLGLIGPMGHIGLIGQKPVMENRPAQQDSIMSNLKVESENSLPQRDSGNSNLRVLGILRSLGWKAVRQGVRMGTENRKTRMRPAQLDSIMSNFGWMGERVNESMGKAENKTRPAQRDSEMSNLGTGEQGIVTVQINNNKPFLPLCLCDLVVNGPAQRYSKMSNLKIETENILPQRHSKMSNLDFENIVPAKRSEQIMFTLRIKNIVCCFGRLSGLLCWPHGGRADGNSNPALAGPIVDWRSAGVLKC